MTSDREAHGELLFGADDPDLLLSALLGSVVLDVVRRVRPGRATSCGGPAELACRAMHVGDATTMGAQLRGSRGRLRIADVVFVAGEVVLIAATVASTTRRRVALFGAGLMIVSMLCLIAAAVERALSPAGQARLQIGPVRRRGRRRDAYALRQRFASEQPRVPTED